MPWALLLLTLLTLSFAPAHAAREPVLKQIDLPHSYYWRELYLPQLTSGPSSVSFLPNGRELVYSMAGSLWRQRINDGTATELTHPRGAYDYQPDVAADGNSVVFARYDGKAIELWRLDLESGKEQALTSDGAVNVEPRLSPDGRQLLWVSSSGSGHFNLFIAQIDAAGLQQPRMLIGERSSSIDRYYYSAVDHVINPSWSPDGSSVYYVGNAEIAWGSGDVWSVTLADPSQPRRILSEESSWSLRPEVAPDGKRLLFSSYHGRQWHQLWLSTVDGAPALPLTFGAFDRRNARWSPDGRRIAFIDNRSSQTESGNTTLRVMEVVGGASVIVMPLKRRYKNPMGRINLRIDDGQGEAISARVMIRGSDGRSYAPANAWVHADDGFDRALQATENHYFHCQSPCRIEVPAGKTEVTVIRGFAQRIWRKSSEVRAEDTTKLQATLESLNLPAEFGQWLSADLHIHMNYGGHYRNTPANLLRQAQAEDLDVAFNLIVNKEQRIPDIGYFRTDADPASSGQTTLWHAQEYHTSLWGHLGLLYLNDHFLTPDFSSYRHTGLASPYPHNGVIADLAHAQQALVGYVHPFDTLPDPANDPVLSNALPADVINGKVDYLEVVGFSDHHSTATVWYRLLNLGFALAAGAGTDAMANYASLRGPVGMNRVYLDTAGVCDSNAVGNALKEGRGFATNGPLLGLLVDDLKPGERLAQAGEHRFKVAMRSLVAVDHLELVHNGKVVKHFDLKGDRHSLDAEGVLALDANGWLLLRAWNDQADPLIQDLYPYATTNPVWLGEPGPVPGAESDAKYFADWLTRTLEAAEARDDYNSAAERQSTLDYLRHARDAYRKLSGAPNDAAPVSE